jgi:uncharacterized SAM-binding protein YcdF (DUF218 family)
MGIIFNIKFYIFEDFFKLIEGNEYRKSISTIDSVDAILVLCGMLEINEAGDNTYVEWVDPDRFFGVIALFKAGKAQKLIFTGGKMPWDKAKKTEGEVLKEYAILNGIPTEKILVTKDVENTAEEAVAKKELIGSSNRIIIVTSAYHMYREQRLLENQGFIVIPYKVDFKTCKTSQFTIIDILPSGGCLELTEIGARELFGRLYYIIKN